MQENVDLRIRTMRVIWIALFLTSGLYYAFAIVSKRPDDVEPNGTLFLVFVAIALSTTLISFLIKSKLINRAVEQQQVQLVQQAYMVAWAMMEVAAFLGLIDFYLTGNRYFYVLFIISTVGLLLHFPQRDHVIHASFKRPF